MPTEILYLSPSSLNRWFGSSPDMAIGCPRAFSLNRVWEPLVEEDRTALDRGTLIHSMLEGATDPATVTDKVTLQMFSRLNNLRTMFNLRILATELRQEFQIMPGVKWIRVIDAIAEDDKGKKIVVDYKCQPAGELVTMADGTELPIEAIRPGHSVLAWDGSRYVRSLVEKIQDGGIQSVYQITLRNRTVVRLSGGHPLLTTGGWKTPLELSEGDRVQMLENWQGENILSAEEARLLGYLIGDGTIGASVRFCNISPTLIKDFKRCAGTFGWEVVRDSASDDRTWRILSGGSSYSPKTFTDFHGLTGKRAWDKEVPEAVMRGDLSVLVNFLAGYFDTDGSLGKLTKNLPPRLTLVSVSRKLAFQTAELLRRIGVAARVYPVSPKNQRPYYQVAVWRRADIRRFLELVPFREPSRLAKRKQYQKELGTEIGSHEYASDRRSPYEVLEILNLGEMPTIGLTIAEHHTYITSGVVTHNSGMGWKTVETAEGQLAPQAEGFQGIGYLIPPPKTARKDWPKEAWFMISGYGGNGQIFRVLHTEAKEANLRNAIELVRFAHRKGFYPAVRGKHCFDCPLRAVCYETPGWQRLYQKKERRS